MYNHVKIGWGRRMISLDEPFSLAGQRYMRLSEGIHDNQYLTAMVIDGGEGNDCVAFLSCDATTLNNGVIEGVSKLVHEKHPEFPLNGVVMNATHSHSNCVLSNTAEKTPDGKTIYPGQKFREFFIQMGAEAVCEAYENRREGGIAYGFGFAVVGHSRRVVYLEDRYSGDVTQDVPDGFGKMYGNTSKDTFSHYEAGADHSTNLMFTFDSEEKLTGIVINIPCPAQTSSHFKKVSSDYWNEVREQVKKEYGEDVYVLTQCAAAGDTDPRMLHYKDAQARRLALKYNLPYDPKEKSRDSQDYYNSVMGIRYDIGERVIAAVKEVYEWAKKDIQTHFPVRHVCKTIPVSRRIITDEELEYCVNRIEALKAAVPDPETVSDEEYRFAKSKMTSISARNNRVIERYEEQKTKKTIDTTIHVVQIGEIAMATTRFELYQDFMHRLQARSPFIQTFVIELAGDEYGSYLATKRGAYNKGYSASMFCNQVSPEGGQEWVEETLKVLKKLKEEV